MPGPFTAMELSDNEPTSTFDKWFFGICLICFVIVCYLGVQESNRRMPTTQPTELSK